VLGLDGERISSLSRMLDASIMAAFGFPSVLQDGAR
jgi:hypothetical protein